MSKAKKIILGALGVGLVGGGFYAVYSYINSPAYIFSKWIGGPVFKAAYPDAWRWLFWDDFTYVHPEVWQDLGGGVYTSMIIVYPDPNDPSRVVILEVDVDTNTRSVVTRVH